MRLPNARKKWASLRRRKGATLVEVLMVITIISGVIVGFAAMTSEITLQMGGRAAAQHINKIYKASEEYIRANQAALIAGAPAAPNAQVILAGRPNAGAAAPAGSLQDEGFLPPTFIDINSYGHRYALLIQSDGAGGINSLVTAYGGRVMEDTLLGTAVSYIGASGGFMANDPLPGRAGLVTGLQGGWETQANSWGPAATRPTPGHLSASLSYSSQGLGGEYLSRTNTGNPEDNRMQTAIDMNSNNLINVGTISGNADVQIEDNLNVVLDVWSGQDIRATRDIVAGRNISGQNLTTTQDIRAGRDLRSDRDTRVGRNLDVIGTTRLRKDATLNEDLTVQGTSNLNVANVKDLKPEKLDVDTVIYSSDRGISASSNITLADFLPRMVYQYSYQRRSDQSASQRQVYKPRCRGGTSKARIFIDRQQNSTRAGLINGLEIQSGSGGLGVINDDSYVDVFDSVIAVDLNSNFWRVDFLGQDAMPGTPRSIIASTYCFYG